MFFKVWEIGHLQGEINNSCNKEVQRWSGIAGQIPSDSIRLIRLDKQPFCFGLGSGGGAKCLGFHVGLHHKILWLIIFFSQIRVKSIYIFLQLD